MSFNFLAAAEEFVPPHAFEGGGIFLPKQASTHAPAVDYLFYYINAVSIVFGVAIIVLTFWWAWKYRSSVHPNPQPAGHNNVLEIVWTVVPALLILVMFWYGFVGFIDMTVAPPNAERVKVTGKMWAWNFEYPNPAGGPNGVTDILYLPKDKPVILEMTSIDTIHSLYIPAFRLKKDVVPGRFNQFWVQATELGEFPVYCTEYCGKLHSKMLAKAVVLEEDAFREKMKEVADYRKVNGNYASAAEIGFKIAQLNGCFSCHSVDGTNNTGPTWKDLIGETQPVASGRNPVGGFDYIYESTHYPQKEIALGPDGKPYTAAMSAYTNLTAEQTWYLTEYFRSLSSKTQADVSKTPVTAESIKALQDQLKDVK
jgi:cytochrome c oxidase subunit II